MGVVSTLITLIKQNADEEQRDGKLKLYCYEGCIVCLYVHVSIDLIFSVLEVREP